MAGAMEAVWLPVLPSFKGFGAALAKGAAADADKEGKGIGLTLGKSIVAGVAVGAAGLAATGTALYKIGSVFNDVSTTISVATGATGDDLGRLTDAAKRISTTVPRSFEDISTAVASVQSSISGFSNLTEAEFDQATTNALNFSKAFEIDTDRVTQVVGQMMKTGLVTDANEAFDLLTAASQKVPAALREDLLDAVDEYGPFFSQLGISGEEAMNALASASDKGVFGIDKTGDALKEFTIRATDMSKTSGEAYAALGLSQEEMSAALLAGGDVGSEAFQKIIGGLQGIQDPVAQSQAALALFGTPLEDLGTANIPQFIDALSGAESVLGDVEGAAGRMGESLNSGPGAAFDLLKNRLMVGLAPVAEWVFNTLGDLLTEVTGSITAFGSAWKYNDGDITSSGMPGMFERLGFWARQAFDYFQTSVLPVLRMFGAYLTTTVLPAVQQFGAYLVATVLPVLQRLGAYLINDVVPALIQTGQWVRDNTGLLKNIALVIGTLLIPMFVRAGVLALISGGQQVAAWVMSQAAAVKAAAIYVAQGYIIIGRWVAMGAAALVSGAQTAYVWGLYQLDAIKAAGVYAMQSLRVIGAWVAMSTAAVLSGAKTAAVWTGSIIAQAVAGAVAFAAQVARVVAGWVLMGAQSLLQAARMAAAWLIALGPIGWITAAVIGIVALVIANWDKISAFTSQVWGSIVGWITGAWNNIKATVSAGINWVVSWVVAKVLEMQARWNAVWDAVRLLVATVWESIKTAIFNALMWVNSIIVNTLATIQTGWTNAWNFVRTTVTTIWDGIKTVISNAWNGVKSTLTTMIDFVRDNIGSAFEAAKDGIATAWNKIQEVAKKPVRFVVERVINDGLIDTFNKIPGVNIGRISLPKGFKNGGYTGDGPADEYAGPAHRGEFYFTKKQTKAIGKERLAAMAHAAVRGGLQPAGISPTGAMPTLNTGFPGMIAHVGGNRAYVEDNAPGWRIPQAVDIINQMSALKLQVARTGMPRIQTRISADRMQPNWLAYASGNSVTFNPNGPGPGSGPMYKRAVSIHELLHVLGQGHTSAASIMQPVMQNHMLPTGYDVAEMQRLYGKADGGGVVSDPGLERKNPFDGLIDSMMAKLKEAFPGGGMFIDAAGGLAKTGIGQVMKIVEDIKNGLKNLADNVFGKVKDFFGGGASTAVEAPLFRDQGGLLPPGLSTVLNATGGNEYVLNRRQWNDLHALATRNASQEGMGGMEVNFNGPVLGDPADIWREFKTETQRASTLNSLRRVSVG